MARSKIEWLARPGTSPESWNLVGGCTKVSAECRECYACRGSWRIMHNPRRPERYEGVTKKVEGRPEWTGRINLDDGELLRPYRWRKPRTVFVCSMSDLFHKSVPFYFIARVFKTIYENPQHTFLILTKRIERMAAFMEDGLGRLYCWPAIPDNAWVGVTVGHPDSLHRIPTLLRIPAKVHFISAESLLGDLNLKPWLPQVCPVHLQIHRDGRNCNRPRDQQPVCLDWVTGGGETSSRARPTHPEWATWLKDQTKQAGLPFFWKSNGEWIGVDQLDYIMAPGETYADKGWATPEEHVFEDGTICVRLGRQHTGHLLNGEVWREWPAT